MVPNLVRALISAKPIMDRLHTIVHQDWENSRPMDLTDEGLLAELEDKDEHLAEDLAIQTKKNEG